MRGAPRAKVPPMRALVVFLFCATALAQEAGQVPVPTPPRAATLNVQLKGTSKALVDSIHGTMFEKAQGYALFITGEKNRTVTCEVRSGSPYVLLEVMRTILSAREVTVSCLNANVAPIRGGALVDLEDPKTGTFSIASAR